MRNLYSKTFRNMFLMFQQFKRHLSHVPHVFRNTELEHHVPRNMFRNTLRSAVTSRNAGNMFLAPCTPEIHAAPTWAETGPPDTMCNATPEPKTDPTEKGAS